MARRFERKSIFITGASSGIGAALACEFAREGGRVALLARREDRLHEVQQQIDGLGGEAITQVCDVTDCDSVSRAVAKTTEAFGGVDVAVANAGFSVVAPLMHLTTDDFRRQFDTNFFGVVHTIYAVLPHLIASRGRLVIVASVLGRVALPMASAYCASKFALVGLAESLHYELARKGVSVTCINPGPVQSEIWAVDKDGMLGKERETATAARLRMPADKAARSMVRAIYRRKSEVFITNQAKVAAWINRHFPRTFRTLVRIPGGRRIEGYEESLRK